MPKQTKAANEYSLESLIGPLPPATQDLIRTADQQSGEMMRKGHAIAVRVSKAGRNVPLPPGGLSYGGDGRNAWNRAFGDSVSLLFRSLAEAWWQQSESLEELFLRFREILLALRRKPEFIAHQAHSILFFEDIEDAEQDWRERAGEHWAEKNQITAREAHVQQFRKETNARHIDIYTKAKVDPADYDRWRKKRPGEERFIPAYSRTSRRIEAVLSGKTRL